MIENLFDEGLIKLCKEGPAEIEFFTGERPHSGTVYRWATKGRAGVVLESVIVTGIRWTSKQAIKRFFVDYTDAKLASPAPMTKSQIDRSKHLRDNEIERQARDLGI